MIGEKNRYISILKKKAGELRAVKGLSVGLWDRWNPLFELLSDEEDPVAASASAVTSISDSCSKYAMVFVDFDTLDYLSAHQVNAILVALEANDICAVPVLTLSTNDEARSGINEYVLAHGRRAAFRIFFDDIDADFAARAAALIEAIGLDVSQSHLIFDLGYIEPNLVTTIGVAFPVIGAQLPQLGEWQTVTLAGTGIPKIFDIPGGTNAELPRTEWEFVNSVKARFANGVKRLDYGDYAITNPQIVDNFDPTKMKISPKIVYASDNEWIAYKGKATKGIGFKATHAMCRSLIQRPEFKGAAFSAGDHYINACAQEVDGPGNSMTWKQAGTNHHITFVAEQVANSL